MNKGGKMAWKKQRKVKAYITFKGKKKDNKSEVECKL